MDYVLGLSLTSSAVRWVLVEGDEGEPVDRGVFDGDAVRAMTADAIVDELLAGSVGDRVVRAVGVTFAAASEATARALVGALTARGFDGVTAVAELAAVDALACGIADVAELDGVVVCVVDDDGAVVAVLDAGGVTVERVAGRAGDPRFADALRTRWANDVCQPEVVFVLGTGNLESLANDLEQGSPAPVSTAVDADLAMARGAALASAEFVEPADVVSKRVALQGNSRVMTLTSVLVAASVTLVVSASVAVGLQLGSGSEPEPVQRPVTDAAQQNVPEVKPPAPPLPTAAPRSIAALTPPAEVPAAPPAAVESVVMAAPPAPEVLPEPPAYVPPAPEVPAYVPPAPEVPAYVAPVEPPAYVPPNTLPGPAVAQQAAPPAQQVVPQPVPPVEQPRLRDRIIDKIPILNRIGD